jgi:hypothetical protein
MPMILIPSSLLHRLCVLELPVSFVLEKQTFAGGRAETRAAYCSLLCNMRCTMPVPGERFNVSLPCLCGLVLG